MAQQLDNLAETIAINGLETDFFSPVVSNYFKQSNFPNELINNYSDEELAQKITSHPQFTPSYREALVNEIYEQYEKAGIRLSEHSEVRKNIERLREENTLTVTTGQQIHVFLGPMFVINKILSCCAEAKSLDSELTNNSVVPIFWMATEDHDFDEIKSARLYNETYTWDITSEGPVGRLSPKTLLPLVDAAMGRIDQTPENVNFLEACKKAYGSCSTFADATRQILHTYVEQTGIVLLDPDSRFLKKQLISNIRQDLFAHSPSAAIDKSIAVMKANSIKPPINTRPINYFMISDNTRNRIERHEEGFRLVNGDQTYTTQEIENLLTSNPEAFSPNALLRPVYQQTILPNLAYVCGGSEFIYWLELKNAMEESKAIYPRLIIRKSVFNLSQKNKDLVMHGGLPLSCLFYSNAHFLQFCAEKQNSHANKISDKMNRVRTDITALKSELEALAKMPLGKLNKLANQFIKHLESEAKRHIVADISGSNDVNRLLKIKDKIWSEDYIQERNKDIISSISEVNSTLNLFRNKYTFFTNSSEIALLIK